MNALQGIIYIGVITFAATSATEYDGADFLHESGGYGGELESGHYEGGHEYGDQGGKVEYGDHGGKDEYGSHGGKDEYYHHPQYHYEYTVHDPHTDDYKTHHESRDGDVVKGYYTLKEADGSLREVHYTADHKNGFQAVVTQNGKQVHPHVDTQEHSSGHDSNYY